MKFTAQQARKAILELDEKRVERALDKIYKRIQSNCETSYVRGIYCDVDTFDANEIVKNLKESGYSVTSDYIRNPNRMQGTTVIQINW